MAQIWSAVALALSVVKGLILQSHGGDDGDRAPWHALLQPFGGVRSLKVDLKIAKGLSKAFGTS
jgi:hypothetical protein